MNRRIVKLFEEVGEHYRAANVATFQLHEGRDLHAFYQLVRDTSKVVHVQGYFGGSSEDHARVWARMMNYFAMLDAREGKGARKIGNEHEAVIRSFPNFELGIEIPYDAKVLEQKLAENVPELRI